MKCENDKTQLARWINNEMTEAERAAFEVHLTQCTECRKEMEADLQVWDLMGEITVPEPSDAMRLKFHAMLDMYTKVKRTNERGMFKLNIEDWVQGKINGDGPEMMMKNMNGNIYVRKAK